MDAYLGEAALYCENCADDTMDSYPDGGGETDSPAHCDECGRPLDAPLTSYGVSYVLSAMREELATPRDERNRIMPMPGTGEESMTYWHGSRHVDIVRSWAEMIANYGLPRREARFVELFLSRTAA